MAVIAGTGVVLRPANLRSILAAGSVFQANAAANTYYQTVATYYTSTGINAAVSGVAFAFKSPFPGSVVGVSLFANGTSAAQYVRVYKNGTTLATFTMGTGTGTFSQSATKGTYSFVAGDYLQVYIGQGTAGAMYSTTQLVLDLPS